MFNKNVDVESISIGSTADDGKAATTAKVPSRSMSVIGPTLVFKGELSADEDLVIEGRIEGTIAHQQKNLTVGKQGRVKADIHAKEATIEGSVVGDIRGDERVTLAVGSNVTGNISSPRVHLADGAIFNGNIDMTARESGSQVTKLAPAEPTRAQGASKK